MATFTVLCSADELIQRLVPSHATSVEAMVRQHYVRADHPASVEDRMAWLEGAGFTEVAGHWRHLHYAVFTGQR